MAELFLTDAGGLSWIRSVRHLRLTCGMTPVFMLIWRSWPRLANPIGCYFVSLKPELECSVEPEVVSVVVFLVFPVLAHAVTDRGIKSSD